MKTLRYQLVADPVAAVAAAATDPGARYLGGGTNLVDLMKLGVETPALLVDVSRLPLHGVDTTDGGGLLVGAAVRNSDLAAHPLVRHHYPVLSQALLAGASGQLRNAATVGGNLMQRTRCPYFQDVSKPCNKREPGTGCPAVQGAHRDLAVLGASPHCVATHPSDMAVALAALDAVVLVRGPGGERRIPVTELHRLPGDHPEHDTVLDHGDLITHVELPSVPRALRSAYRKARDRASYAFALASVAAALELRDGVIQEVRLAFGALAAKPWRATTAEEMLRGQSPDPGLFARAADAELAAARPLRDNAYKIPLVRNLTVRVLADLAGGQAPAIPQGAVR